MLRSRPAGDMLAQAASQGAFLHRAQWIISLLEMMGSFRIMDG
jgi:hypothetical protein